MLTIIAIIALFASLVIFHELGHFIAARRNGVEVDEFGIGFPPRLIAHRLGKTLLTINLLPLGGFVRMRGEDGDDTTKGSFGAATLAAKTKILLAGVGMNIVSAFLILYVLCLTGMPALGSFEPGFLHHTYAQTPRLILTDVVSGSPAAGAGIKRDDYLVRANGQVLVTDDALRTFTSTHAGQEVVLDVEHAGATRTVTVKLNKAGGTSGYLGVTSQQLYRLHYDPLSAVAAAAWLTGGLFVATIWGVLKLLISLPGLIYHLFGSSVPAAADNASGPVGIVYILQSAATLGWAYIFLIMANISVALAAFNALPLPALDGGRLAVLVAARLRGRSFKPENEAKYHITGFIALIGLMVLITVYDIRKFF